MFMSSPLAAFALYVKQLCKKLKERGRRKNHIRFQLRGETPSKCWQKAVIAISGKLIL
jgi:hypothetical protein